VKRLRPGLLIGAALLLPGGARAHDGLHVDIQEITARIAELESPPPELLLQRARLLREHGKPKDALADLDRVDLLLGERPDSPLRRITAPLLRAQVLVDLDRSDGVLALLDGVLTEAPDHPGALDLRADLRVAAGNPDGAIEDRRRAFEALPTLERTLTLGAALSGTGRLEAASRLYARAIERLGESLLIRDAWISNEIARGEFESALAMIGAELGRAAVRTPWLLRRAEVYRAAGNEARRNEALDAALAEADRVIARRPLPVHLVSRARVRLARGELDAAEDDARLALERVPEFALAATLLAEIRERRESVPEAPAGEGATEAPPDGG